MILVLDFGTQYTQLIARRVREQHVYCEIHPFNVAARAHPRSCAPEGIILSGGPSSVYADGRAAARPGASSTSACRVLGICYGMSVLNCRRPAARSRAPTHREYGAGRI